jgi:hypothetical protein
MQWKEVAEQMRGSRDEVRKRIEGCSLKKIKELLYWWKCLGSMMGSW